MTEFARGIKYCVKEDKRYSLPYVVYIKECDTPKFVGTIIGSFSCPDLAEQMCLLMYALVLEDQEAWNSNIFTIREKTWKDLLIWHENLGAEHEEIFGDEFSNGDFNECYSMKGIRYLSDNELESGEIDG